MTGQAHDVRWVLGYNVGSTDIPPYGLLEVSGASHSLQNKVSIQVKRPTSDGVSPLAINGWKTIPAGEYGLVTLEGPVYVLYTGSPATGEIWGAAEDSFNATTGKGGLVVIGVTSVGTTNTIVLVDVLGGSGGGTRGGCLAENHKGRGVKFNIHLGTWDTATDKWIYEAVDTVAAIDWRYGVPYPNAGCTGLFEARPSDTYGTIWETVALDCEDPGDCGD